MDVQPGHRSYPIRRPFAAFADGATGVARHVLTGHFRSRSMLGYLVLPMSIGSVMGAAAGGYLSAWAPGGALRVLLAIILLISALKLLRKSNDREL